MVKNKFRFYLHKLTARLRKHKLFSFLLNKTGKNLDSKKWIFIVGCYNSGTTLLNQILASHPNISGLPDEGVMLTDQLMKPEDLGWRRMWWKCEKEMEDSQRNRQKDSKIIKRHWSHFYEDTEYLVEKSISNTCRLNFFEENFQPAYFIHIVRNGYAVAAGIQRKAVIMEENPLYGLPEYPINLCINQWKRSLEKIEEQRPSLKRYLEISYEEFTETPLETMDKVTNFLNLPPFERDYFTRSFAVHEKTSEIKNMNSRSIKKLSGEEIEMINSVAEKELVKYGYEIL